MIVVEIDGGIDIDESWREEASEGGGHGDTSDGSTTSLCLNPDPAKQRQGERERIQTRLKFDGESRIWVKRRVGTIRASRETCVLARDWGVSRFRASTL